MAYVRGNHPPINFCPEFRNDMDTLSQQSTVLHEFCHFLAGVRDQGGYAAIFGAQSTTCSTGFKFTATPDLLVNTADALAGFVLHIGQRGSGTLQARPPRRRP